MRNEIADSEAEWLTRAKGAIVFWYDTLEVRRVATVPRKGRPKVPALVVPDANAARRARGGQPGSDPKYWARFKQTVRVDQDGRPVVDKKGRLVYDSIPIEDATTASGRQSRNSGHSKPPRGAAMDARAAFGNGFQQPQRYDADPISYINTVMNRVLLVSQASHRACEHYGAGWTDEQAAKRMRMSKGKYQDLLHTGLGIVVLLLIMRPEFEALRAARRGKQQPRKMFASEIGLFLTDDVAAGLQPAMRAPVTDFEPGGEQDPLTLRRDPRGYR